MSIHRFWIEIVMVGTGVACALALLIATLGAVAGAAGTALGQQQSKAPTAATVRTYEGMVTCSRCGARHSAELNRTAADCARICVHAGAQFALVDGEKMHLLEGDLSLLKKIAGQRARITGSVTGNTIRVSSVATGT